MAPNAFALLPCSESSAFYLIVEIDLDSDLHPALVWKHSPKSP